MFVLLWNYYFIFGGFLYGTIGAGLHCEEE